MTAVASARPARVIVLSEPEAPLAGWPAVIGLGVVIALALLAGKAGWVRLGYPLGALAIGAWLYSRGPAPFIEFSWWLWHLTPGIRRIVDYQLGGWDPQNPISLTPFLVSGLALIGVCRRLPELKRRRFLPWGVAAVAIVYGFFVGVLRVGLMPASHALISWLVPLGFGLFCAVEWRRYPECQAAMRRAFVWGSVVLAVYGIIQFVNPPAWDVIWMMSSGMYSVGRAFPYEVRVFSLVNAPLPFATILVAGMFIALSGRGYLRMVSLIAGTVALLLSLVRSVWLAGFIGFLVYLTSLPLRSVRKMVLTGAIALGAVAMVPVVTPSYIAGPTVEMVTKRFLTFGNVKQDVSYKDRASFLDNIVKVVVEDPLGHGLGSTGVSSTLAEQGDGIRDFDNGVFAALYSLGWFAGALLLGAAMSVVAFAFYRRETADDVMAKAARAIAVTSLVLLLGANVFEGVSAAVLWGFAGLVSAAHQWHDAGGDSAAELA